MGLSYSVMDVAALISGGKDSIYAAWLTSKNHKLKCLITLLPEKADSWMFHTPNIFMVQYQAEMIGLPLISMHTSGEKEEELKDLMKAIKIAKDKYKIEGVVSGALASEYQRTRIEAICKELKLKSITPLWHMNIEQYMLGLILNGFEVIIVQVAADGFTKEWLGRRFDRNCTADLKKLNEKYSISIVGEGGEYETFVLDCPLFKKKIKIIDSEVIMENECTGKLAIKDFSFGKK